MTNPLRLSSLVLGATVVTLVYATWPVWRWLWLEWSSNPYYSHGIVIVPIVAVLIWRRVTVDRQPTRSDADRYGLLVIGVGVIGLLLSNDRAALHLAAFAMIVIIIGITWTFWGYGRVRQLRFPLLYLAVMIPLPAVEMATLPLALFTGTCSGFVTNLLGVEATIVGSSVTLPDAELTIGAQCSGINSIISLTSLTLLGAYVLRGPWWGKGLLVMLAIPLAMLGNILRVSALLVVAYVAGLAPAFDFYHDYSGIVSFFLVALLMVPLSRLVQCREIRFDIL